MLARARPRPLPIQLDPIAVGEGGREAGGDLRHGAKMGCLRVFGEVLSRSFIHARSDVSAGLMVMAAARCAFSRQMRKV